MGDFNAIRRADYNEEEWGRLVQGRTQAGIDTETKVLPSRRVDLWWLAVHWATIGHFLIGGRSDTQVTEELELPTELGGQWGMTDCRSLAANSRGGITTSCYGARVDYMWLRSQGRSHLRVTLLAHIQLEPEDVTDHRMVICELAVDSGAGDGGKSAHLQPPR